MKMTFPCASRSSSASRGTAVSRWSPRLSVGEAEGPELSACVSERRLGSGSVYRLSRACDSVSVASLSWFAGVFVVLFAPRVLGPENVHESLRFLRMQYEQGRAPSHLTLRDLQRSQAAGVRSTRRLFSGRARSIFEVSEEARETDGGEEGEICSESEASEVQGWGFARAQTKSFWVAPPRRRFCR